MNYWRTFSLALVLVMVSCVEDQENPSAPAPKVEPRPTHVDPTRDGRADYLVTDQSVGNFELGQPLGDMKIPAEFRINQEEVMNDDGKMQLVHKVSFSDSSNRPLMYIESACPLETCEMTKIYVLDANYKTTVGVGCSNTVSDIKRYYEISLIRLNSLGNPMVHVKELNNIVFELMNTSIPGDPGTVIDLKDVPDTTPIIRLECSAIGENVS